MPNLKRGFTGSITIAGREVAVTWDGSKLMLLGITDETAAIGLLTVIERGTAKAKPPADKVADSPPTRAAPKPAQEVASAVPDEETGEVTDTPEDDGSEAREAAGAAEPDDVEAKKKAKAADRATKARDKRAADKAAKAAAEPPAAATETETETETATEIETETATEPDGDPLGITETIEPVGPETVEVDAATAKKSGMNGAVADVPDALKGQRTIRKVLLYLRDTEGLSTLAEYIARCEEIKPTVAILSRVINMADKVERAMGMLD